MDFVRLLLGTLVALVVSVFVQIGVIMIEMIPYHFGIDMGNWPIGDQHWLIYSSETIVASCGILAAAAVAPPEHRAASCWIVTVVCLGISLSLMHMIGKGHNLPNPGWLYYLTDPILLCFALGGSASSLFFTLRSNKSVPRDAASQQG